MPSRSKYGQRRRREAIQCPADVCLVRTWAREPNGEPNMEMSHVHSVAPVSPVGYTDVGSDDVTTPFSGRPVLRVATAAPVQPSHIDQTQ